MFIEFQILNKFGDFIGNKIKNEKIIKRNTR